MKQTTRISLLAALAAISLSASPIAQVMVTETGVNGASTGGYYTSPYYLTIGTQTGVAAYCDDFLDPSSIGQTWHANIFSGADLSGTYFALSDPNYVADYAKMFWLVNASITGAVDPIVAQEALWEMEDPTYAGSLASQTLLANAGTVSDLSDYLVIDQDPNPASPTANPNAPTPRAQEFIAQVSQAPEPGTWGLVIIGFGLCYAGKRKAAVRT